MPNTVDSLEIKIQSEADSANKALDSLIAKLGVVAQGITSVGKNDGLSSFAKQAVEASKGLSNIQSTAKGLSSSVEPQMRKITKGFEQISDGSISPEIDLDAWAQMDDKAVSVHDKIKALETAFKDVGKSFYFEGNTEQLDREVEKLQSDLEKLYAKRDKKIDLGEVDTKSFVALIRDIQEVNNKLDILESSRPDALNRTLEENAEKARLSEEALENLYNKLSQLQVPEIREDSLNKLESGLEKAENKLDELRIKLENGLTMGSITESADDSGFVRLQEQIALTEKQAEALRERIAEIENARGISRFERAFNGLASAGNTAKTAIKGVSSVIKTATSGIAKFIKSITSLKRASGGMNSSFAGGFKNVLKYAIGIRSLYTLFNKLRSAVKEGMNNLAQYSNETNASISLLSNSMNQLKNASAAMAAPLLNAVAPALNTIIQLCIRAMNALNQLFSALTGKGTWIKAKTLTDSYAKSIGGAGAASSKAAKEAKAGLREFDELKTINMPDESGGGGGGGGGGIDPSDMFETVELGQDMLDLADKIKKAWANADFTEIGAMLGENLKKALDSIDWEKIQANVEKLGKSFGTLINGFVGVEGLAESIGRTLGEGLNTIIIGLNSFLDSTDWASVGDFIGKGLRTAIETIDFAGIGHLFAQGLNAIFDLVGGIGTNGVFEALGAQLSNGINQFISDFNWAQNGASLGELAKDLLDGIIAAFGNTDWKLLGIKVAEFIQGIDWVGLLKKAAKAISNIAEGALDLASGLLEGIDWVSFGDDLWKGLVGIITNINWTGLVNKAFKLLGDALGAASGLLVGLLGGIWDSLVEAFNSTKAYFDEYIDEMGGDIILGLLQGILAAIADIGSWIYDNIFKPFIDGFKKAFGIASPSKVMDEQGTFIMQGLLNGITALVQKVVDIFVKIKDKIVGVWEKIGTKTSEIWGEIKKFVTGYWSGIRSLASSAFEAIKNVITGYWSKVKSVTSSIWGGIKNFTSNLWGNLKSNASNIFSKIKDTITSCWSKIKTATTNIWAGIRDAVKGPINSIIRFINQMISGVVKGINSLGSTLNNLHIKLPDGPWGKGADLGFNIPTVSAPQIPELANGAVLRGGNPFLAIVNDQKRGQTNVETPLKVIQQALRSELDNLMARKGSDTGKIPEALEKLSAAIEGIADTDGIEVESGDGGNDTEWQTEIDISSALKELFGGVRVATPDTADLKSEFAIEGFGEGLSDFYKETRGGYIEDVAESAYRGTLRALREYDEKGTLNEQNRLLAEIADKDFGMTTNEIGNAARKFARDFAKRTGREAYSF